MKKHWSGLQTLEKTGRCQLPLRWCWVTPKSFFQKMLFWSSSDCCCLRQFVKATLAYHDTWGECIEISGGEARESCRTYWKKNADDMWKYSLLKREWHGLTSRVSKLDQHLYFDSRCLRTSETVIEQDLKRTRMSLSRTIHIHHLCKVTCHKWQHSASRQSTGVVLYKTCME
jgi:hypothetical protein